MSRVPVVDRWSVAQVLALAPDATSQRAARGLASPGPWRDRGWAGGDGAALWGLCQGSGSAPYQTCVDLVDPGFRCSCPSRKTPCKHALGLLLLWAGGEVPEADPPPWVDEWRAAREDRAQRAQTRREASGPVDPERAARTAERRAERVSSGLAELDRWLADQVRGGLAVASRLGYGHWDAMAARLVDAQAPAAAGAVKRLAVAAVSGSPDRLLTELALLHLLVAGHGRLDELPDDLAATVRTRVGYPVAADDVLTSPPVRDRWQVVAVRDEADENLTTRRVWLRGIAHGRPALVLSFVPTGQPLPADLPLGTVVDADMCFYPGRAALRALVAHRHAPPETTTTASGGSPIEKALWGYAEAVAADPWLDRWPMLLDGVVPVRAGDRWFLVDGAGDALPLLVASGQEPWRLVAAAGGHPVPVAGEWTQAGLRALTTWSGGTVVPL